MAFGPNQLGGWFAAALTRQEVSMLFAVSWVNRDGATEEREKRSLKLFTNWKPPAGFDFKGFYD